MRYLTPLVVLILMIFACTPENEIFEAPDAMLEFSLDTLRFDTVFTEIGSATRTLKVYNPYDQTIIISKIRVESGKDTRFRFNIDGIPTNEAGDIEIRANDSLYIFGEVTVNPDEPLSDSPYVIEDFLVFETNGNTQKVLLEAYGQNANYIPNRFAMGKQALLSCDFGEITWDDPKPYVIYGILIIDQCQLNIPAGARIYVHGGIVMADEIGIYNDGYIFTLADGSLNIRGTAEDPVIIQGDRLEEPFQEVAGQWTGIILGKESKGNVIEYAEIKNARFGVLVDSLGELTTRNSRYYNTVGSGLIGFHSRIKAENCLFYNNFNNAVQLIFGGDYEFNYCTVASYGVDASAIGMSNFFCYDADCEIFEEYRLNASFKNSIFYGSRTDEIILSDAFEGQEESRFNYNFENCIVRVDELTDVEAYANFFDRCDPCINPTGDFALFLDPNEDDYHLDTLSIAEGMAMPLDILIDLENNARDADAPDIGCYEYQY